MDNKVTALPFLLPMNVNKSVKPQIRISASKARKHHQQIILGIINSVTDSNCQLALSRENAKFARAARKERFIKKYGNLQYAANGIDILPESFK